jgi:N-acetylmuramoyl-L-alanine amidase
VTHAPVRRRALPAALLPIPIVALVLMLAPAGVLLTTTAALAPPPVAQDAPAPLEITDEHPVSAKAEALALAAPVPVPSEEPAVDPTADPTPEPTQEPEPEPASEPEPTQEPEPEPEPVEDDSALFATPPRSLYLSIGHGRRPDGRLDTGTIHPRTGQREIDAAAIVVQAMTEVLQQAPNLTLWAQSGNHPNVVGTVKAANQRRADDCIEIHQDWYKAPPGVFAHWHPSSGGAKKLADRLVHSLGEEGNPIRGNWHKARPGLHFLRASTCRAVLVEVGRVGDYNKEQLVRFGRAMAHAYLDDLRSRG